MDPAVRTYGDGVAAVVVVRPGEEAGVGRSLDAVAAATRRAVHVVVADSRAGGPALEAGAAEVLPLGEDVRAAAAVNRAVAGLGAGIGWVAATWAGTAWRAGAIDALLEAAEHRPRAGMLRPAAPATVPGPVPSARGIARRPHGAGSPRGGGAEAVTALLRPHDEWPPGCSTRVRAVLLRRAAFDSVDGFDPRFPALAVLDVARRLDRAGWLVVPVPDAHADGPVEGPPGRHAEVRRYLAERNRGVLRAPLRAALLATAAPG